MVNLPLFFSRGFLYFHPNNTPDFLNHQPISVDCFDKQKTNILRAIKLYPDSSSRGTRPKKVLFLGFEIKEIEIQQKCIWTNQKSSTKKLNLLSISKKKNTISVIFFAMRLVYWREHLKGRAFSLGHQLADALVFFHSTGGNLSNPWNQYDLSWKRSKEIL